MDLSVVIVAYRMARELPRTLRSLCPPCQLGLEGLRLEIIVVENGPDGPPDFAPPAGIAYRWMRASVASASPVPALNAGLAAARGTLVGAWIDGARMASPGLLRGAVEAARLAPRPVVATLNHQLGPKRQAFASETGYDQAAEDRLLDSIGWPADGYRLFGIATPEMPRPDAPMLESNALFLPRALWAELGGFDPAFDEPGGGAANPDMLRRAVAAPGTQLLRLLEEGTFHQFHGGVSTSDLAGAMRALMELGRRYAALRGVPLAPVREVGRLVPSPVRQGLAG